MDSAKQNHSWDRTRDQLVFLSADLSRRTPKGILRLETHRSSFPSLSGIEVATTHQEYCCAYRASARYPTRMTWLLGS